MKNFLGDLRFGLRMLRKSPGFALTAIGVLALGIGANAAVFSVVEAVLLRSLPLRDPERVVMLWEKIRFGLTTRQSASTSAAFHRGYAPGIFGKPNAARDHQADG